MTPPDDLIYGLIAAWGFCALLLIALAVFA
jgi:hypothetical protein